MESKKKKKLTIILTACLLIVAIATIGIFYVVDFNKKGSRGKGGLKADYISSELDTNIFNEAIADGKVSNSYYGTYEYSTIKNICFNNKLTEADIETICRNKGTTDVNGLIKYLNDKIYDDLKNAKESIVFSVDGRYSKVRNGFATEIGQYIGDDNLSLISLLNTRNEQKYYLMSLNYAERDSALKVNKNKIKNNGLSLYLFEDFYSKENPSLILFTVTYEYNYIPADEVTTYPDSMLDF